MTDLEGLDYNSNEETLNGRFLTFKLGKETYGIAIRYVIEIVGMQPLTEMPEMPESIKGIINLRGKIIPVMDVRLRFDMSCKEYDDRTCIIVIDINNVYVGLIIDSVSDVISISNDEILPKPELSTKEGYDYIKNIGRTGDQVILLIDCGQLFNNCEMTK